MYSFTDSKSLLLPIILFKFIYFWVGFISSPNNNKLKEWCIRLRISESLLLLINSLNLLLLIVAFASQLGSSYFKYDHIGSRLYHQHYYQTNYY